MINGTRFLGSLGGISGGLGRASHSKAPENLLNLGSTQKAVKSISDLVAQDTARVNEALAKSAAKQLEQQDKAAKVIMPDEYGEFADYIKASLNPKTAKRKMVPPLNIKGLEGLNLEYFGKKLKDIFELYTANAKQGIDAFLVRVQDFVARTCIEIYHTALSRKNYGIMERYGMKPACKGIVEYLPEAIEKNGSQERIHMLNGHMLDSSGNPIIKAIDEKTGKPLRELLAQVFVSKKGKPENFYNALSEDGSAVAVKYINNADAKITILDPTKKVKYTLELADNKLTYTDAAQPKPPKTKEEIKAARKAKRKK